MSDFLLQFPKTTCGLDLEAQHAMQDVMEIVYTYGQPCIIRLRKEANVTRDEYNSIKERPTQVLSQDTEFWAYPIEYTPTSKKLEKAGLREVCDVSIWTATYQWDAIEINFKDIDIKRTTVIINGEQYEVKEKSRASQFATVWLYTTFGLSKR